MAIAIFRNPPRPHGQTIVREDPHDLIRLAELIKLASASARVFADLSADGYANRISEAADKIDAAAEDLIEAGRNLIAKTQ